MFGFPCHGLLGLALVVMLLEEHPLDFFLFWLAPDSLPIPLSDEVKNIKAYQTMQGVINTERGHSMQPIPCIDGCQVELVQIVLRDQNVVISRTTSQVRIGPTTPILSETNSLRRS
jgi:hypothetical protein